MKIKEQEQEFRAGLTEIERQIFDHLGYRHRAYMKLFRQEAEFGGTTSRLWEFQMSKKEISQIIGEPPDAITTVQRMFVNLGLMKLVLLGGKSADGTKYWPSIYAWTGHTLTNMPAMPTASKTPCEQPKVVTAPSRLPFNTPEPYCIKGILGHKELLAITTSPAWIVPAIAQLAASVSVGGPWLGHQTRSGRVLILTARPNNNIAATLRDSGKAMGFPTLGKIDILHTKNVPLVLESITDKGYGFVILNQYLKLFKWGSGSGDKFNARVSHFLKAMRCPVAVIESSFSERAYAKHGAVGGNLSLDDGTIKFVRHDQPDVYRFGAKFIYPIFKRDEHTNSTR